VRRRPWSHMRLMLLLLLALQPADVPRIECANPATLQLRRFEDGSAQLRCDGRVVVRVAVPG